MMNIGNIKRLLTILMLGLCTSCACAQTEAAHVPHVEWDRYSLIIDGHRVCPVMGEIHYSRIPADEWQREVHKMKEGGVTMVATYVFWNHVEEEQGVFRWDGQRDLRRFLEVCQREGMPVVLRLGPWCHGEVRNGGIPDWMFATGAKLRSTDRRFLDYTTRLYRQIFTQVQGLQWGDGGPVIACQFDNEYRGSGDYLMALKSIARSIGFDLPFYTRTGWPELSKPTPYGEMLPLYGDYADGFWDKDVKEGVGNYYQAFNFKQFRSSTAIGTDVLGAQQASTTQGDGQYPYFTCELGGGMATAYHRRPYLYPEDAYAMALVKLGSGSNLLGYYMYHGGTNPEGRLNTLNEVQTSPGTANNDLPVMTYDFQCPLGEYGQPYPQYYLLRKLHLFMHDYGEVLAPMESHFEGPQNLKRGEDTALRWAYRSQGDQAFVFINNYERLQQLSAKDVRLEVVGVQFPRLKIPSGTMCIFPVNIDGIRYATAQLIARRNGRIYMEQIPGIPTTLCVDGRTLRNVKPRGTSQPVYSNIYLLTPDEASHLFLPAEEQTTEQPLTCTKVHDATALRTIAKGKARVASAPTEEDWKAAAVYRISIPSDVSRGLMSITYRGDCARLYADGRLVADNFYYGRPFLYGLWRLPHDVSELTLRVLPLQPDAPIYLPREADKQAGEEVSKVTLCTPVK